MNTTQKQRAYRFLREKLIAGELPPGSRLSDLALSKEIGVSRTPVREAINQLANEHFVDLIPRAGAFVKVPDRRELADLYDLRQLLESYAVKQAAAQIQADNLKKLEEIINSMDAIIAELAAGPQPRPTPELRRRWVMTDYAFHLVLFQSCGNQKITQIAGELRMLTQAFTFRKDDPRTSPLETMRQANREHRALFEALKEGNKRRAGQIITRHLE